MCLLLHAPRTGVSRRFPMLGASVGVSSLEEASLLRELLHFIGTTEDNPGAVFRPSGDSVSTTLHIIVLISARSAQKNCIYLLVLNVKQILKILVLKQR